MSEFPPAGGHELPPRFPLSPAPQSAPRARAGWVTGSITGTVVLVVLGALQVGANLGYDDAEDAFDSAVRTTTAAVAEVRDADVRLESVTGFAGLIVDSDSGTLVDDSSRDALTAAITSAEDAASTADDVLEEVIPEAGEKPMWFWELFSASGRLNEKRSVVERLDERLQDLSPEIADAEDAVTDAGLSLLSAAAGLATGFESAHLSARNDDVIALRDAASAVASTTTIDQAAVDAFVALEGAASQVVASEQAELAEKAGPLQSRRLEIEAFARSLAPGVLLEFDWNQIVNGAGGRGSMGGLTTWWWDEPDRALIELSNSVAEQWPSIRSKSLVAHEVGHAISVKCEDLYDSSTQDSIEQWATAWAISMGYADDANGVWAYGYPPQSYIDAAYGCR